MEEELDGAENLYLISVLLLVLVVTIAPGIIFFVRHATITIQVR